MSDEAGKAAGATKWTVFPLSFIYTRPSILKWVLYSLWLVLPLETWTSIWIGAIKQDAVLAPLALVFYKAITLVVLALSIFYWMPSLAKQSSFTQELAGKLSALKDPTGGVNSSTAAIFLFWFSTAIIWSLSYVLAWYFQFAQNDDPIVAAINLLYHGESPAPWYAGKLQSSWRMALAVSAIYSLIAYLVLLLIDRRLAKRYDSAPLQQGPNGIVVYLTVVIVNALFLILILMTVPA